MKVISGGQTGVDIAALRAAKDMGFSTGGYMPRGWKTQAGIKREYETIYGMKESRSGNYDVRTGQNVRASDATIRIAAYFSSPGEVCTLRYLRESQKPNLDIDWDGRTFKVKRCWGAPMWWDLHEWIWQNGYKVVNFAGNSENTARGIEEATYQYLLDEFTLYQLLDII